MVQNAKFGIISLQGLDVSADFEDELHLAPRLRLHRSPPYPINSHWQEWLGSLTVRRYEESKLHIVAEVETKIPGALDNEHREVLSRAHELYWCLHLVGFVRLENEPLSLQGTRSAAGSEVRAFGEQPYPVVLQGSPFSSWDTSALGTALTLQRRVEEVSTRGVFARLRRILEAFHSGVHARSPDFRLHQFVRCVEGFIAAEAGCTTKRFKSRTELFVGPSQHMVMGRLYEVRSNVEHLRDPLEKYSGSRFETYLQLWHDAVTAEEIARSVIRSFILNPSLWPHFKDDSAAAAFWTDVSVDEKRHVWGAPLDLDAIRNAFQGCYLEPEDLGLSDADR